MILLHLVIEFVSRAILKGFTIFFHLYLFYLGCIQSAKRSSNKTQSIQQMASAKMTVKSMISKVKVCTNLKVSIYDKNVFECNLFNFLAKSRRRKYENRSQRII